MAGTSQRYYAPVDTWFDTTRRCMTSLRCDGGDAGQVSETLANMEALERMFELRTHLELAQAQAEARAGQR